MSEAALPQQSPFTSAVMKILQGPDKGDIYRIQPPGIVIGRDPNHCQIVLSDDRVSRQQCRIDFTIDGLFIEDVSGKSTTFVNMQNITTQILRSGDQLGFGDTIIEISMETPKPLTLASSHNTTTPSPMPNLPPPSPFSFNNGNFAVPETLAKEPFLNKKNIIRIGFGVILATLIYLGTRPEVVKKPKPIASPNEINQSIEAVKMRQDQILNTHPEMDEREVYNHRKAENYYIRGFRDYYNKQYSRAIESFQTTLAIYPNHTMAKRYLKLSEKLREGLVDSHMDLGTKYRNKSMYKLCMAEFEKALQIINQPENKKYQLAKEQIKECRLLEQGSN
ncbi:MAG: FHA domain-containing protein [Bdellovibrionaceae bacterium]|nr:FHA domain-containing protein [Pseudobdellovibrionaceae bacterium]